MGVICADDNHNTTDNPYWDAFGGMTYILADSFTLLKAELRIADIIKKYLSTIRLVQPDKSLKQHRLSRATTTDDKVSLTGIECYRYIVEYRTTIKRLKYILTLNHRINWVNRRLKSIIIIELTTTAVVEALPTSREFPFA